MTLSQAYLKSILEYDPLTGVFLWSRRVAARVQIGDVAGTVGDKGYRVISVCNRDYKAHQLAWLYMTGEWPTQWIDHCNGIRGDNRWANLRLASPQGNAHNARTRKDNSSGFKGVCWHKGSRKWAAYIQHGGKRLSLGRHATPELAAAAYAEAAQRLHGEFARVA